jgi:hypothetical protein
MKTSIFDMNFTLPPLVEMSEVMKDMPNMTVLFIYDCSGYGYD